VPGSPADQVAHPASRRRGAGTDVLPNA
jgi:hypothetical protein